MSMFQAMSTSSMKIGSMTNVSMMQNPYTCFPSPTTSMSMTSYYKSMPALDKHLDQLDKELQQLSDSVDVLYQQEDSEIDFLDSFIDYDDISVYNGSYNNKRPKTKSKPGLPPIIPSETVTTKKDKLRDGLKWLSNRGKLSLRQFGSRDNLKIKDQLKTRGKEKKLDLSALRSNSDLRNCRT